MPFSHYVRICHRCGDTFRANCKGSHVCGKCKEESYKKFLERKREIIPAKTLYEARMRAIKNFII